MDRTREWQSVKYLSDLQARGKALREEREARERAAGVADDADEQAAADGPGQGQNDNDPENQGETAGPRGVGSGAPSAAGNENNNDNDNDEDDDMPPLEEVGAAAAAVAALAATDPITGPKAADMTLFGDDDADEIEALTAPITAPDAGDDDEATAAAAAGEHPLLAAVDAPLLPAAEEMEVIRPKTTRLLITELNDEAGADADEEIPEEIHPRDRKPNWVSIVDNPSAGASVKATAAAAAPKRPLIQMLGDDTINALD